MLIKRPVFNRDLSCVAMEVVLNGKEMTEEYQEQVLRLIQYSESNLPIFIPYHCKSLAEQLVQQLENPVILKLSADEIEHGYSREEIENSIFSIALLINKPCQLAWLNFADYIALTEQMFQMADMKKVVKFTQEHKRKIMAYNISKPSQFEACRQMTMDFFCGDFLMVPINSDDSEIAASKINLLQLIQVMQNEDVTFDEINQIIVKDPLITYQLLKIANSAAYGGYQAIQSIEQALMRLGLKNLKHWVLLISMKNVSNKPKELLESGLIRAHMVQSLAPESLAHSAYTAGLLSILDSLLDKPMDVILTKIVLADEILEALLQRQGPLGQLLALVVAYEEGKWDVLSTLAPVDKDLSELYLQSMAKVTEGSRMLTG